LLDVTQNIRQPRAELRDRDPGGCHVYRTYINRTIAGKHAFLAKRKEPGLRTSVSQGSVVSVHGLTGAGTLHAETVVGLLFMKRCVEPPPDAISLSHP